jgi:hypothetical protein
MMAYVQITDTIATGPQAMAAVRAARERRKRLMRPAAPVDATPAVAPVVDDRPHRKPRKSQAALVRLVLEECAAAFHVPVAAAIGRGRIGKAVQARRLAIYLLRQTTPLSFRQIGRRLGRDHATAVHHFARAERDPQIHKAAAIVGAAVLQRFQVVP